MDTNKQYETLTFEELVEPVWKIISENPILDVKTIAFSSYAEALLLHKVYEMRGEFGLEHSNAPLTENELKEFSSYEEAVSEATYSPGDIETIWVDDSPLGGFASYYSEIVECWKIPYAPLHDYLAYGDPALGDCCFARYILSEPSEEELVMEMGLLDIKASDSVLSLSCHGGSTLVELSERGQGSKFCGFERFFPESGIASLRSDFFDNIDVIPNSYYLVDSSNRKYDKVYLDIQTYNTSRWNEGDIKSSMDKAHLNELIEFIGPCTPINASYWLDAFRALDFINEDGTAVVSLPLGCMKNLSETHLRRKLIDSKMLRGVVSIVQTNLYKDNSVLGKDSRICFLVLGKNEGPVQFVNATDLCIEDWRSTRFSVKDAELAVERYRNGGVNSRLVESFEIIANGFNLDPATYTQKQISFANSKTFKDLILSVTRGTSLSAKELDQLSSATSSATKYLRITDIVDGRISSSLPSLKEIDCSLEKYCLKEGDLLISKSGAPFKIAVAHVSKGDVILATGNLYIIRLNLDMVDPSYVAAFLQSKVGLEMLARASTGTTIPTLSVSQLKNLQIPTPSLREQAKIVEHYESSLDEIQILKLRAQEVRDRLADLFGEVE